MPTDLASIWSELRLYLAPLLTLIIYMLRELGYFGYKKPAQNHNRTAQTRTISLQKIEQREPSRHPPVSLSLISLICAFLLLAFGIWAIYMWIAGIVKFQMDFWIVLFFLGFIGLPLWIIGDHLFMQPKYYKQGRSHVTKEARITVTNDADAVFDACYRVLDSMQATIRIMERPNLLKAKVKDSMITITIIEIEGSKVRVYVLSDSKWLTVRWDGGANQRNIDNFLRELGKQ